MIWQDLKSKTPFTALAPMEDVTDSVFRQMIAKIGKPDIFWTEFASTDGIESAGREKVIQRFAFSSIEKPIIAQIWGNDPNKFYKSAEFLSQNFDFDGIDINMGCPVRDVVKKGACSALIQNPDLAIEIISATKEGAGKLSVSVKTRIGFSEIQTEEWCGFLLKQGIDALIVHGRTRKQNYGGEANWDEIGKVVKLRNGIAPDTVIIGNGDIKSLDDIRRVHEKYEVDGVMVGRGILQNPWLFNPRYGGQAGKPKSVVTIAERFRVLAEHVELHQEFWDDAKPLHMIRKYLKAYINDFTGAKQARIDMMEMKTVKEIVEYCESKLQN